MIDCEKCVHMHQRVHPRDDKLHCYMFEKPPEGNFCAQFKRMPTSDLPEGMAMRRSLGDGREICVLEQTFGKGRVTLGHEGTGTYDDAW